MAKRAREAQPSFDDLIAGAGTPLSEVTFCVLDLETTGGSSGTDSITEIGAIKVRGGETSATFQTLVNPGRAIPPEITVLTGITHAMVCRAPRIETVLGTFVDFIADAVIVGHNVRFDMGFLQAALAREQRPPLGNVVVDTVPLARRLLRDEVPNCKLGTLADRLALQHRPSHRALDDAVATADLLHVLLERAGRLGVTGLDDLRSLPTLAGSAHASKLRLTERLPRSPGVYLFRDRAGHVLYVGKATNLRSRVRQYFSSDTRRKVGSLLRQTERIDHKRTACELEASVLEQRLIQQLSPRFNHAGTRWDKACYVRFDPDERWARLKVVRGPGGGPASIHLGPINSRRTAALVVEAVHGVFPLQRRTLTGEVSPRQHASTVSGALRALVTEPALVVAPLTERMHRLAAEERFEEAATARDRLAAFESTIARQRRFDELRARDRLTVRRGGLTYVIERGVLTGIAEPPPDDGHPGQLRIDYGVRPVQARPADPGPPDAGPLPLELAGELSIVSRWLDT